MHASEGKEDECFEGDPTLFTANHAEQTMNYAPYAVLKIVLGMHIPRMNTFHVKIEHL